MASNKAQKDTDKAIRHLIDFIQQSSHWGPLFQDLIAQHVAPVAEHFEEDVKTVTGRLLDGPYGNMAFGFLFEEMACAHWHGETETPVEQFLKQRGWRESPHGRRYLRAMLEADLQFLEVTRVESGKWVEVRQYGTIAHAQRIIERSASQSLRQWDAILARVVITDRKRRFTGAILPMSRDAATYLEERLKEVPEYLAELYQEIIEEDGGKGITENLVDEIPEERFRRMTEDGFTSGRSMPWIRPAHHSCTTPTTNALS